MKKQIMLMAAMLLVSGAAQAETIKASVNGLVCAFCATGIEKTFKARPEVEDVKVDLESKLVTIHTKGTLDDATLTELITNAGYTVTDIQRGK